MFPVDSDFNLILLICDITDLLLPPSVRPISSFTSLGTCKNYEKSGVLFSAVKYLVRLSSLSIIPFLWGLLGTLEVIFGHFFIALLLFFIHCVGFAFVAPRRNNETVNMAERWNYDTVKWWYARMIKMCQYSFRGWNGAMIFCFVFRDGEMVKSLYGVMVIWWNFPTVNIFFRGHIFIDGEMVKKNQ